jgi:hypothetical protein
MTISSNCRLKGRVRGDTPFFTFFADKLFDYEKNCERFATLVTNKPLIFNSLGNLVSSKSI